MQENNIRLGQTGTCCLYTQKLAKILFKFSINKHGPVHSDLSAPWQEPEVRGATAGVVHLGKQAESFSTFCSFTKKTKKC